MRDNLNNRPTPDAGMDTQYGRAMNIIGQLEELLRDIRSELGNPRRLARQGLDLIATLDRLDQADPDVPKQSGDFDCCTHGGDCLVHPHVGQIHNFDAATELRIETYRAELTAGGGF